MLCFKQLSKNAWSHHQMAHSDLKVATIIVLFPGGGCHAMSTLNLVPTGREPCVGGLIRGDVHKVVVGIIIIPQISKNLLNLWYVLIEDWRNLANDLGNVGIRIFHHPHLVPRIVTGKKGKSCIPFQGFWLHSLHCCKQQPRRWVATHDTKFKLPQVIQGCLNTLTYICQVVRICMQISEPQGFVLLGFQVIHLALQQLGDITGHVRKLCSHPKTNRKPGKGGWSWHGDKSRNYIIYIYIYFQLYIYINCKRWLKENCVKQVLLWNPKQKSGSLPSSNAWLKW